MKRIKEEIIGLWYYFNKKSGVWEVKLDKMFVFAIFLSIIQGWSKKNCTLRQSVITFFWNKITF